MATTEVAPDAPKTRKPPKPKSVYHLFTEADDGCLQPIGQFEGRNAEDAAGDYYTKTGTEANGDVLVIIPDRNMSRVRAEVQTVSKVKLTSA